MNQLFCFVDQQNHIHPSIQYNFGYLRIDLRKLQYFVHPLLLRKDILYLEYLHNELSAQTTEKEKVDQSNNPTVESLDQK